MRYLPWSFGLFFVGITFACDAGGGVRDHAATVVVDTSHVRQSLFDAGFPYDTLTVQVTAPDMATPLSFVIDANALMGRFSVPAGPARIVSTTASIAVPGASIPVFWGQDSIDMPPDGTINLTLNVFSAGTVQGLISLSDNTVVPDSVTIQATAQPSAVSGRSGAPSTVDVVVTGGQFKQALTTGDWAFGGNIVVNGNTYTLDPPIVLSVAQGQFTYGTLVFTPEVAASSTHTLAFIQQPKDVVAGAGFSISVGIVDDSGQPDPSQQGNVTVLLQGASSSLQGTTTATAVQGVARFSNLTIGKAGQAYTITATSAQYGLVTSSAFKVNAGTLVALSFVNFPKTLFTTSSPYPVTVAAVDSLLNPVASYQGAISFSSTDASATLPGVYQFATADAGIHTFASGLKFATAGSQTVTVKDNQGLQGRGTVTVSTPPGVYNLSIAGGATFVAGVTQSVVVSVLGPGSAVYTGYTGSVSFSSADGNATLPSVYQYGASDAGVHTFAGVGFKAGGSQTLTVVDTTSVAGSGSHAFSVSAAAVSQLAVSGLPTSPAAGGPASFKVAAQDPYGNTNATYAGAVSFSSSDAAASFTTALYTFAPADSGAQTFSVTFNTSGPQSITATDTATATITGTASVTVP